MVVKYEGLRFKGYFWGRGEGLRIFYFYWDLKLFWGGVVGVRGVEEYEENIFVKGKNLGWVLEEFSGGLVSSVDCYCRKVRWGIIE